MPWKVCYKLLACEMTNRCFTIHSAVLIFFCFCQTIMWFYYSTGGALHFTHIQALTIITDCHSIPFPPVPFSDNKPPRHRNKPCQQWQRTAMWTIIIAHNYNKKWCFCIHFNNQSNWEQEKDKKSLHLKVTLTEEHDSIPVCIVSVSGILSLGCVFSAFQLFNLSIYCWFIMGGTAILGSTPPIPVLPSRFFINWANHCLVDLSSFRHAAKVLSRNWSGRHCRRASRAL